jgi:hypothetical protein
MRKNVSKRWVSKVALVGGYIYTTGFVGGSYIEVGSAAIPTPRN